MATSPDVWKALDALMRSPTRGLALPSDLAVQTEAPVAQWALDPQGQPELLGWEHHQALNMLSCPICGGAVVESDRLLRKHEEWHARTDFPVPDNLVTVVGIEATQSTPRPESPLEEGS